MATNAVEKLTDISGAMAVELGREVVSIINRKTVLASRLAVSAGKGPTCAWDVRVSGATAGTYTEGATITDADLDSDSRVQASLSWGLYRSAFGISSLARAVASNGPSSPDEFANLVLSDAMASARKLASTINVDLYSGSTGIIGLDTALDASTTFAGLSKSTYTEWAGNALTNGGTARALTKDLIDSLEEDIYTACGEAPDMFVTTPAIVRKFGHLLDSKQQVIVMPGELSASGTGGSPGPRYDVESGETGYTCNGVQVLRDKDATAGYFYMLNSEYLGLEFVPVGMDQLGVDAASMARQLGLGDTDLLAHFSVLGKDGSRDRFLMELFPALKVKSVHCHGFIADIDET